MEEPLKDKPTGPDEITILRHDIRNQLSNIQLVVEELRYEIVEPSADVIVYLDMIASCCININVLLKSKEQ
jgi:hypothetical protein